MKFDKVALALFFIGSLTITLVALLVFPNQIFQVFSGSGIAFLIEPFLKGENEVGKKKNQK